MASVLVYTATRDYAASYCMGRRITMDWAAVTTTEPSTTFGQESEDVLNRR
jgi:hypothetical protein